MSAVRFAFAGTTDFSAQILNALCADDFRPTVVITPPDKPAHRGMQLQASAVKKAALQWELPILQPESLRSVEVKQQLLALGLDFGLVAAYGLIIPTSLLTMPTHGWLNVHPSLLPEWRGAAPIQRAMLSTASKTGVSIMQLEAGLDTGPTYLQIGCDILDCDTLATLSHRLMELSIVGLKEVIRALINKTLWIPKIQKHDDASYAHKLEKSEAKLDFNTSVKSLHRKVLAFQKPGPVAFIDTGDRGTVQILRTTHLLGGNHRFLPGEVVAWNAKALSVATLDGLLHVEQVQLPNRKPMTAAALKNGYPTLFKVGEILSL